MNSTWHRVTAIPKKKSPASSTDSAKMRSGRDTDATTTCCQNKCRTALNAVLTHKAPDTTDVYTMSLPHVAYRVERELRPSKMPDGSVCRLFVCRSLSERGRRAEYRLGKNEYRWSEGGGVRESKIRSSLRTTR